jgi:hypothetical protein
MPDPNWPATLPQRPLTEGYVNTFGEGSARTDMDAGPPKVRKRFTATVDKLQMSFLLDATQVATLRAFFATDCAYGAVPFVFADPVSGASQRLAFSGRPSISARSGTQFVASLELDWLPS